MARHPHKSFCGSPEHNFSRRGFLGGASALVGIGAGLETLRRPAMAEELKKKQKRG